MRGGLQSATLLSDGKVLVAGGLGKGVASSFSQEPTLQRPAEIFDPLKKRWRLTGPMAAGRIAHSGVLLRDGRVLVAGGPTAISEVYSPTTGEWKTTGPLSSARSLASFSLMADGRVLAAGGTGPPSQDRHLLETVEVYDPAKGAWSPASALPSGRESHTATLLKDGATLITGGEGGGRPALALDDALIFRPEKGQWEAVPNFMTEARLDHAETRLRNGEVLLVGGRKAAYIADSTGNNLATAEIYNPRTQAFRSVAPMSSPRGAASATLIADGRVLVAGGCGNTASGATKGPPGAIALNTAEIYDPAVNRWSETPPMVAAPGCNSTLVNQTTTLLKDGRVLVIGGEGGREAQVFVPERWKPVQGRTNNPAPMFIAVIGGLLVGTFFWRAVRRRARSHRQDEGSTKSLQ